MLLKQLAELLHIELVQPVQLLCCRLVILLHPNRTSNCGEGTDRCDALSVSHGGNRAVKPLLAHSMDGSSVGHQTKGVLENATGVEERQGDAHDAL